MKCPFCVKDEKRSRLYPKGRDIFSPAGTLLAPEDYAAYVKTYYDEEGKKHVHNSCTIYLYALCSRGHNWRRGTMESCPSCDYGKLEPEDKLLGIVNNPQEHV